MEHPEYPGWAIQTRLLIDGYPLLMLEKDGVRIFVSEGQHKLIIEFLLNIAEPAKEWQEHPKAYQDDINYKLHQGFVSGEGWAEGQGTFYGHLIRVEEFEEWKSDDEFVAELERYQQRTGQPLTQAMWKVALNSGSWRGAATYIPQSSVEIILEVTRRVRTGQASLPEGVETLSEDEWDLRFGWAASTGLHPSLLPSLEAHATEYLEALKTHAPDLERYRIRLLSALADANLLNREFENQGVYYQLKATGHLNLKTCLDNAEYLYGYLISHTRQEYGLPHLDSGDLRDLPISLDWCIHSHDIGHAHNYEFLAAAEQAFRQAKPSTLEPISAGFANMSVRLHLVMDAGQPKLAHAQRIQPPASTESNQRLDINPEDDL